MKVGDLVKYQEYVGIITKLLRQKHWDCDVFGSEVRWDEAPMMDFANVMFFPRGGGMKLLVADLEVVSESR